MKLHVILSLLAIALLAWPAQAQQTYTGGLLQQDFNSLPMAGTFDFMDVSLSNVKGPAQLSASPVNASGAAGWSFYARVGSPLKLRVDNGGSDSPSAYAFGPVAGTDRALGSLSGSAHGAYIGWRLINNTGQTITQFTLTYRGEQWRNGGSLNVNKLDFAYRITSTLTTDIDNTSSYTLVPALDFTSPVTLANGFALNGNSSANRTEISATVSGISWSNGQLLILRWRDTDETGSDDGLAIDDVMFFAPTTTSSPAVVSISPTHTSTRVLTTSPVIVSFNQPVTTSGTWFEVTGSSSGPIAATVTNAGPMRFTITPVTPFVAGETITVRVIASQVTNASAQPMSVDAISTFNIQPSAASITTIHDIQSSDGYSPLATAEVTVQGVVVGDFQGASSALGGFFLQEEDGDADADPLTSEGIWISDQGNPLAVDVSVGDLVRVTGIVSESGSLTQLLSLTAITKLGTAALPSPSMISLPASSTVMLERFEGMNVLFPQTLSVTSNSGSNGSTDSFARFGELLLSANGPLISPTEIIDPNDSPAAGTSITGRSNVPAIRALENAQALRSIVLDDASTADTPDPTPFLNAQGTRRVGDTVTGLKGILTHSNGAYRVQPTGPVAFVDSNPRPASPPLITGRLKVASMNVLNYFTTFGGTNDRGASNADEFQRQKDKIITALVGLDADVLGLIEIQNTSIAVNDILTALNAAMGSSVYTAVPDPATPASGDYIRTVLLYRPSKVSLFGPCYADADAAWNTPNPLRNPIAQVFIENSTGERFIACLNHWKSKSSSGATGLNTDQNDGQAAFNDQRKQQAARVLTWLQGICAASGDYDVIIMGDLNSLGEEDPLDVLRNGGFTDQGERFQPGDYSYRLGDTRGRLDHAFASSTMAAQTTDARHRHINADEPAFYDYNTEGKTPAHLLINVGTPYRSSDHDPVLIGVSLAPQPTTFAMWTAASSISGAAADVDNDQDGMRNLMEFVLVANPSIGDLQRLPVATRSGNTLQLDYRLRTNASGITVTPQWSEDLVIWNDLTGQFVSTLDSVTAIHRASVDTTGKGRVFMRLRASMP